MLMLIYKLTWSLCSATSSAKPLLGVGMTFASVALFGSGSCVYKRRGEQMNKFTQCVLFCYGCVPLDICPSAMP